MKSLSRKFRRVRPLLGTYVSIELQGESGEKLLNAYITEGFAAIAEVDRLMSYHRRDSDLSRLNRAKPGAWVSVSSPLTLKVLRTSNELFRISRGVFDIRCGGVLAGWGELPSFSWNRRFPATVSSGVLPLEIQGMRVRKLGPWILDLGGIAKGYAVDRAVEQFLRPDLKSRLCGVVNAGGDLRVWGSEAVPVGVKILGESFCGIRSFTMSRTAAATSSVRARRISLRGHVTSAHVEMPSGKFLKEAKTVTVFASQCLLADALTKIVLLGSTDISGRCLSFYRANALVFGSDGRLEKIMG